MRSASSWLAKALEIDHQDSVAAEFYRLVSILRDSSFPLLS